MSNADILQQMEEEKIPETIEYIRSALIKRNVEKKEISRTLLTAEDVLVKMMDSSPDGTKVWVSVGGLFGNVDIRLSACGKPFDSSDIEQNLLLGNGMDDEEANDVYNLQGQKVLRKTSNIERLPKGVYIINGKKIINK